MRNKTKSSREHKSMCFKNKNKQKYANNQI